MRKRQPSSSAPISSPSKCRRSSRAPTPPDPHSTPTFLHKETIMTSSKHAATLAAHSGPRSHAATGAVAVPIYQTTSFQFRDTEHAANLFALKEVAHIYSRITNPTNEALELKLAALEGGAAAMAVSSGQAATALAIQNICHAGDNI